MPLNRSTTLRFLITGGSGQLGRELTRILSRQGVVVAPSRAELDLARPATIREAIRRVRPTVIVNAAAYTDVDRAESDRAACMAVNADGPAVLATEASRASAALIHYSTDYVFDGTKSGAYVETDGPAPLSVYGQSKLDGERALATSEAAWIVVRTSWLYAANGKNFLTKVLELARDQLELQVVDDQIGAPTPASAVAAATASLVSSVCGQRADVADGVRGLRGIYHYASEGSTSWCGFARAIFDAVPDAARRALVVRAIPTEERAAPARRPANSRLDSSRIMATFGVRARPWRAELADLASTLRPSGRGSVAGTVHA